MKDIKQQTSIRNYKLRQWDITIPIRMVKIYKYDNMKG